MPLKIKLQKEKKNMLQHINREQLRENFRFELN